MINIKEYYIYGAICLIGILAVTYYGHVKYSDGYDKRNLECVQEIAKINEEIHNATIEKQKSWSKIDSRPRASTSDILKRMRAKEL